MLILIVNVRNLQVYILLMNLNLNTHFSSTLL